MGHSSEPCHLNKLSKGLMSETETRELLGGPKEIFSDDEEGALIQANQ